MYEQFVKELREAEKEAKELYTNPYRFVPYYGKAADIIEALEFTCDIYDKDYKALWEYVPKWIPVEERLPDKSGNYLTAFEDGSAMAVNEFMHPRGWLTEEGHKANPNGKWYWGGVTHWMPLPEPPKEKE